jgi:hypothetical protein
VTDESDAKPAAQVELDAQVKPGAQVKPAAKHKKSNALLNVMIAISAIAMIGALGLIAYPTFSDWWNRMHQSYAVAGYVEQTKDMSGAERKAMLKAAHEYNERLAANGDVVVGASRSGAGCAGETGDGHGRGGDHGNKALEYLIHSFSFTLLVISSLILSFQPFGEGVHRTATGRPPPLTESIIMIAVS